MKRLWRQSFPAIYGFCVAKETFLSKQQMKRTLVFMMVLLPAFMFAQSTKDVINKGILSQTISEIDYSEGLDKPMIEKQEFFNAKGQLVELKEYNKKEEVKVWEKYTYTVDGEIETESYFDKKGALEKKVVYKYVGGLKTEKHYLDDKGRLIKKKIYAYEYKK